MDELERSKLKAQLQQEIEEEFAKRTNEHRARVHAINARRRYREAHKLKAAKVPLDFLAMGDSWFDYPLNDWGVPWTNQAIVAQLQTIGNPSPIILSRAVPGNAMTKTMGLDNQGQYVIDIQDPTHWLDGKPDAILVSGGGDDVVGDQFVIYLDYFGGGLSTRVQGVVDSVEASYQALFQFRDLHAPNTPIFGHCYDYAIPNGHGAALILGPWLKPSLDFTDYNYADGLAIVKDAIDRLYNMLNGLASIKKNKFILVDTRGTLTRDTLQPLGWANEIHPYTAGFLALANKFIPALRTVFPGRI
jgi:hypothetical protein